MTDRVKAMVVMKWFIYIQSEMASNKTLVYSAGRMVDPGRTHSHPNSQNLECNLISEGKKKVSADVVRLESPDELTLNYPMT